MVIKNALDVYSKNVNKIKKQKTKKILNSDLASTALDARRGYMYNNGWLWV